MGWLTPAELQTLLSLSTVKAVSRTCACRWTDCNIKDGVFFSLCRIPFTCIYQLLSLYCYHRDTPSPSASRLWLQGSLAFIGETLVSKCLPGAGRRSPSFDRVSLVAGVPAMAARRPVLSPWVDARDSVKSSWEKSTPVIEMSSPGRQLLRGACWRSASARWYVG